MKWRAHTALACVLAACSASPDVPVAVDPSLGKLSTKLAAADAMGRGVCLATAADMHGPMVWADGQGLWASEPGAASDAAPVSIDTFAPGLSARPPLALEAPLALEPALVVALDGDGTCELRIYDGQRRRLSATTITAAHCDKPSGDQDMVVWPVGLGDDEGDLRWIDTASGNTIFALPLGAAPVTPAAALTVERLSGGGSHWVVGTTHGVLVISDPLSGRRLGPDGPVESGLPRVVGSWSDLTKRVTSLLVVGRLAVVTLAGETDPGLGSWLRVLRIDGSGSEPMTLVPIGDAIAVSGAMTAHPVALACGPGAAQGACEEGGAALVVAAGDGWLAGWHLPSGVRAFEDHTAILWTGLSLGRGGWVAGGGSHWLPSGERGWRFVAVDPVGAEPGAVDLAVGLGDACVPSPLWDTTGALRTPVITAESTVVARALLSGVDGSLGLATGSPRPYGDARNSGGAATPSGNCTDGVERDLSSVPDDGAEYEGVVVDGPRAVLFGALGGQGLLRWVEVGRTTVDVLIPETARVIAAASRPAGGVAVLYREPALGDPLSAAAYDGSSSEPVWKTEIGVVDGPVAGMVAGEAALGNGGDYFVATRAGDHDSVFQLREGYAGAYHSVPVKAPEPVGVKLVRPDGKGGVLMVLDLGTRLGLRLMTSELGRGGYGEWSLDGREVTVLDATTDAARDVRVLAAVARVDGGSDLHWLRFDRLLTLLDDRVVPSGRYAATLEDGTSLLGDDAGLRRVSGTGAVGLERGAVGGARQMLPFGVADAGDGFVVAFWRPTRAGRELAWGHADQQGFLGCGEAGVCADQPADTCDGEGACVVLGCAPALGGSCAEGPVAAACEP